MFQLSGFCCKNPAAALAAFSGQPLLQIFAHAYNDPEVDRIWSIEGICHGWFKGHILSTPGWLCRKRFAEAISI